MLGLKNLKKKLNCSNLDANPRFSTSQSIILPPKPPAQLLTFCTFRYLYTALDLKSSLTVTLWPSATYWDQAFPVQPTANDSKIIKI